MRTLLPVLLLVLAACGDANAPGDDVTALRDKIVFTSDRDGHDQLYVMNIDGSNVVFLPLDRPGAVLGPAVSPDGRRIAFYLSDGEVYVMNAEGTDIRNLTNHPAADAFPAWSPDGTRIAFNSNRDGSTDVFVMNADGSNPINLTNNPAFDGGATWSPDGSRIAFQSERDGNGEVYVMNADGSDPVNLTVNEASDQVPAWSHDGQRIAFKSDRGGLYSELFVMDADGGNQAVVDLGPLGIYFPKWSPDDAWIAFDGGAELDNEVLIVRPDGTGLTNLTDNSTHDFFPAWSPAAKPGPLGR
jgi:Tol biopolymer transport system component